MIILHERQLGISRRRWIHLSEQFVSKTIYRENCCVNTENRITTEMLELLVKFVRMILFHSHVKTNPSIKLRELTTSSGTFRIVSVPLTSACSTCQREKV